MTTVKNDTGKTVSFSIIKEGKADPDQRVVWFTVPSGNKLDVPSEVVWRAKIHGLTTISDEQIPPKQTPTTPKPQKVSLIQKYSEKELFKLAKSGQVKIISELGNVLNRKFDIPTIEGKRVSLILSLYKEVDQ